MVQKELGIRSERSDDIPLIIHWLTEMRIVELIDENLPTPHGNREGLSYGQLSVLLLSYIVSQGDHRLCAVEPWVKQSQKTLERSTGWRISEKEVTDDRLGALVEVLGKQLESREQIELGLGQHLIRAYALPTEVGRCDTSSFSVYHQLSEDESRSGILQYGHSKDHRPDLRQYRQLLATLDPAGVPLVSSTLAGNGADDPIYVGVWEKLAAVIGHKSFVYVADCKAASHQNRARLAQAGGVYCFPLPETGQVPQLLQSWVLNPPAPLTSIRLAYQTPEDPPIGVGFEMELGKLWRAPDSKTDFQWIERYLLMHSYALAERQIQALKRRLEKAEASLTKLSAKLSEDRCKLQNEAQAILKRHRVQDFFSLELDFLGVKQTKRQGRPKVGKRANKTAEQVGKKDFFLNFHRQEQNIQAAIKLAGWRIYVTNGQAEHLTLSQALSYYREQWQTENGFHRFKRGNLPALPIYFQNQDRIIGLMFLLTIALRVFTLMEFVVRRNLQTLNAKLSGLYDGNPRRTTERPSAEQMLRAFRHITLYLLPDGTSEITPLNPLQQRILALMNIPEAIYDFP